MGQSDDMGDIDALSPSSTGGYVEERSRTCIKLIDDPVRE
jgi:hypothetical protein